MVWKAVQLRGFFLAVVLLAGLQASGSGSYRMPPDLVVDLLDRPSLPEASLGPGRDVMVLVHRQSMPTLEDLSVAMLRLAGLRFNPHNRALLERRSPRISRFDVLDLSGGQTREIRLPDSGRAGSPVWAPDGSRFAFTLVTPGGVELWLADVGTAEARKLTDPKLNLVSGPCDWFPDSRALLCRFVPDGPGPAPSRPLIPEAPVIQETRGDVAPARTYQDLLNDSADEASFEYFLKSQLVRVALETGDVQKIGEPALFDHVEISPDGRRILVERVVRPYSYLVPQSYFAKEVEVWDAEGRKLFHLAGLPLAESIPVAGVRTGPRRYRWQPGKPSTLVWLEALDDGDPKKPAEFRDRILQLAAPFGSSPAELARMNWRVRDLDWAEDGLVLVTEYDRDSQRIRISKLGPSPGDRLLLWEQGIYENYNDAGTPLMIPDRSGRSVLQRRGESVFLRGRGGTPEGDFPFLDRFNLETRESARLFRSEKGYYETVLAVVDKAGSRLLTQRESPDSPSNYFLVNLSSNERRALTEFVDPAPELKGIRRELITYRRQDGIELSATLLLPPGYQGEKRLPVVFWAYPREYNDPEIASQVRGSTHRFTRITGPSHLFFLTQGYAILDGPAMPIVGKNGNDTFVEQLIMNAKAAIDAIVELGVADPDRIGVGGHSYGAFMAANLLAHSDFFAAGIARSGAYNRTLTPFGFQNERRTYWEAPDVYIDASPFMHADRIKEPILLIHGEADNNSGTFPLQSLRLFHALKGLGGTARLVILPGESHSYAARESVLHVLAEMLEWFDKYVKNRRPE